MKRRTIRSLWVGAILAWSAAPVAQGAAPGTKVRLVAEGRPAATIVLTEKPTRAAQLAAFELQAHVQEITGAKLPIVRGAAAGEGTRILVGVPGDYKGQEYVIQARPGLLLLAGRDKADFTEVRYDPADPSCADTWPGLWDEQATLYAVYDFLERCCGVRWFNPTDTGTICPQTRTLEVTVPEVRRAPHFRFRDAVGAMGENPQRYDAYVALWHESTQGFKDYEAAAYADLHRQFPQPGAYGAAKAARVRLFWLRMRAGGDICRCNHSLYGYYDRFWEKNPKNPDVFVEKKPDWFAQGYEGQPPQLCYTNRGLIAQVAQDARDYFDGKKTGKDLCIFWNPQLPNPFPVEPMDNSSFCKCAACQALLNHADDQSPHYSKGTHSEYFFHFVNEVAREVRQTHPDQLLVTLAYMTHAVPPKSFKLLPNVAVQFCFAMNRAPHSRPGYEHEMNLLRRWAADDPQRPLYLWLYYCFPVESANSGKYHCFPGFFAHAIGEQFKLFRECGVRGMFHCGYGQEVEAYVTYKLMDDPTLDVDALLEDYFTGLYGPAAGPMKQLYRAIEETYCNPANYPQQARASGPELAWGHLGTAERMAAFGQRLAEARALAQTDLQKRRIELFDKGVWSYMQAGRQQYTDRMKAPIPSLVAPRVPAAEGDLSRVAWDRAAALTGSWFERGQNKPAARRLAGRAAHDGRYFYLELVDPCDTRKLVTSPMVFPYDDWEIFIAAQRAQPYRQYAVGPTGQIVALSHGEVNWRQNVPMSDHGVKAVSDTSAPDRWVTRVAIPLTGAIPGGVQPGQTLYLNVIRVTSPAVGGQYPLGIDTWVSYCTVHEVDRLGAILLEK